ncbi:MAG TPA: DinB family protein [Gemmatimonadales bacterium]
MNQEALRSRLLIELDCVSLDAVAVAKELDSSQLGWRPPGGGWGIGQLLEHLILANDCYLGMLRPRIYARNAPHSEQGTAFWEPSIAGWLLVAGLRSKRRLPAPKPFAVGPTAREKVLDEFLVRQQQTMTFLRATAALDWTRLRMTSPVNKLVRINLGDAFSIMTVHAQRHIKQMEKIRDLEGFPGKS